MKKRESVKRLILSSNYPINTRANVEAKQMIHTKCDMRVQKGIDNSLKQLVKNPRQANNKEQFTLIKIFLQ